jgi:hypothetical protein
MMDKKKIDHMVFMAKHLLEEAINLLAQINEEVLEG